MEKKNHTSNFSFPKGYLPLLVSTGSALCLFLAPDKVTILLEAAIFVLVAMTPWILKEPREKQPLSVDALLLAAAFAFAGLLTFYNAWIHSSLLATVAGLVHLPIPLLTGIIGFCGAIVGLYGFYRLARYVVRLLDRFLPNDRNNCKTNWLFPVSALAFFWLEAAGSGFTLRGLPAAVVLSILIAGRAPAMLLWLRSKAPVSLALLGLSAAGICWAGCRYALEYGALSGIAVPVAAILAFPFVLVCLCAFFCKLAALLQPRDLFRDFSRRELRVYAAFLVVLVAVVSFLFLKTDVFYGTAFDYDLLYTSDSPMLVKEHIYTSLCNPENDLRQPLFALFAAPFLGIFYFVSFLFRAPAPVHALLINLPQLALLFFGNLLLAKALELSGGKRMAFVALVCCSYPFMLFTMMMEQYIFAYFYLMVFVYLLCGKGLREPLALWGAGGSLLTSVVLLPLLSENHPVKRFRCWFRDLLDRGLEFVGVLLVFGRMDIIIGAANRINAMGHFSGEALTLSDKFFQYSAFIASCIWTPAAEVIQNRWGQISWQLVPASGIHIGGIVILLLCILSAVWNRDKISSRVAAGWAVFSFVVLFGLGWGTQENGLILYALYFGWAFVVLLYQLAEKICSLAKKEALIPLVTALAAVVLAGINLFSIAQMVSFAMTHYPL